MSFRFLLPAAGVIFLGGCMVGPKYKQPAAAVPPAYKELPETDQWKVAHPNAEALRSNWWEIFGDPQLNALEEQVTVSNQNLKMAEARFRQARATVRYYRAGEFPTIAVSPGVQAFRYSPNQPYFPSSAPAASIPRVTSSFLLISPTKWTYGAAYVAPWQLPARKLRPAPAISQP